MCAVVWDTGCAASLTISNFLFNVMRGQSDSPIICCAPPKEIRSSSIFLAPQRQSSVAEAVKKDLIQWHWSGTSSHPTVSAAAATDA